MKPATLVLLLIALTGALQAEEESAPARIDGYAGMPRSEYAYWAGEADLQGQEKKAFLALFDQKQAELKAFDAEHAATAQRYRQEFAAATERAEKVKLHRAMRDLLRDRARITLTYDKQAMDQIPKDVQVNAEANKLWDQVRKEQFSSFTLDDTQQALARKICRRYARIKAHNAQAEQQKLENLAEEIRDRVLTPVQRDRFALQPRRPATAKPTKPDKQQRDDMAFEGQSDGTLGGTFDREETSNSSKRKSDDLL